MGDQKKANVYAAGTALDGADKVTGDAPKQKRTASKGHWCGANDHK